MTEYNTNHKFKKSLGQNFLIDREMANKLIETSEIKSNDLVIEIGPGEGILSEMILKKTNNLILIEKDRNLKQSLVEKFSTKAGLWFEDVLDIDFAKITKREPYHVIGSLPYNVSKKIIFNLLTCDHKPIDLTLVIQKEVAKSYASKTPNATLLSNFANLHSEVKLYDVIPSESFFPKPQVDGQIIRFTDISTKVTDYKSLWSFIRMGFSSPRKILAGNLRTYGKERVEKFLLENNFSRTIRASEINLEDWVHLHSYLKTSKDD